MLFREEVVLFHAETTLTLPFDESGVLRWARTITMGLRRLVRIRRPVGRWRSRRRRIGCTRRARRGVRRRRVIGLRRASRMMRGRGGVRLRRVGAGRGRRVDLDQGRARVPREAVLRRDLRSPRFLAGLCGTCLTSVRSRRRAVGLARELLFRTSRGMRRRVSLAFWL